MITQLSPSELTLETDRLILTPLSHQDLAFAQGLLGDPDVMQFISDPMTPEQVAAEMPNLTRRGGGGRLGIWCVNLKDTQEKIGTCVLLPIPIEEDDTDWDSMVADRYPDSQVEVGYILAKSAWGQGIASETCTRLLQFAFEHTDLSEVIGLTYMGHVVSQHVLKKCGLTYQKRSRAYACDDVDWFEISRDGWTARTA